MANLSAIYRIGADITNLQQNATRAVQATERIDTSMNKMMTTAKMAGTAIASAFTVGAVTAAVKSFTDLTGQLTDMAAKTGLSTTELQKLKYAADLSGGSIETVTTAVTQMSKRLVEGESSAVSAMQRLGLNILEIRQMSPGEAFQLIADRIAKIPSPMEQATLAMQLFGKSGAEVLPLIKSGLTEAMQAAERLGIVMDESTIAAGDRLGDTFTTLSAVGQGVLGKVFAPMVPAVQLVADAMTGLGGVVTWLQDGFTKLLEWGVKAVQFFVDAIVKVSELAQKMPILGSSMRDVDKAAIESLKSWSVWLGDMAKGMSVTMPATTKAAKTLASATFDVGTTTKVATAAAKDHMREVEKMSAAAVKLARDHYAAAKAIEAWWQSFKADMISDSFLGEKGRAALHDNIEETIQWIKTWTKVEEGIKSVEKALEEASHTGIKASTDIADSAEKSRAAFEREQRAIFGIANAFGQLGSQIGGTTGDILRDVGNIINAFGRASDAAEKIREKGGFMNTATGVLEGASAVWQATGQGSRGSRIAGGALTGAKVGMAFGPWGAAIGAGIGAITGWVRGMNEGRKAVKAFAESFGGFDELHRKLAVLGAEGEGMWVSLTQGVGNNNPQQAAEVIGKINTALGDAPNKLNAMVTAALTGGPQLSASMVPFIEDLIRTGQLTQENANLLMGLPAKGVPAFSEVAAAAEALGLDINSIGENIKQLGFSETVEEVAANLDILQRAGADMDAVLTGSRDKIQKLVDDAMRFGRSLPESIKPFLQQMADSGKLVDLFGNQLTDLDDLHFTKPLEQGVEDLITALHELVGVIRDDVGGALDDLGNRVVRPRVELPGSGFVAPGSLTIENNTTVNLDGDVVAENTARAALGY